MTPIDDRMAHALAQPLAAIANYVAAGRLLIDQDSPFAHDEAVRALDAAGAQAERAAEMLRRFRSARA